MWGPNVWVFLTVFTTVLTFSISYPLAVANDDIDDERFTLSASIANPPQSMIGSLGLSLSAACTWMLLYLRYKFIQMKDPGIDQANYITYLLGSVGALGAMGVGAFQVSNAEIIHYVCAFLNFIPQNIYVLIHTWYIDPRVAKLDPQYKRGVLRCVTSITGIASLLLMIIFHQSDLAFSLLEIILMAGFMLWILTLYNSFEDASFDITMNSVPLQEQLLSIRKPNREDGLSIEEDEDHSEA